MGFVTGPSHHDGPCWCGRTHPLSSDVVTCSVVFMSPDECVRRIKTATDAEAVEMLRTLESAAEAEAYRRGQEAFRERVLELNMHSYDHEMIRKLPIEEEEVADGR